MQVGLAAEESGDLQESATSATVETSCGFVHVGEDGHVNFVFHFFQDAQAFG